MSSLCEWPKLKPPWWVIINYAEGHSSSGSWRLAVFTVADAHPILNTQREEFRCPGWSPNHGNHKAIGQLPSTRVPMEHQGLVILRRVAQEIVTFLTSVPLFKNQLPRSELPKADRDREARTPPADGWLEGVNWGNKWYNRYNRRNLPRWLTMWFATLAPNLT